MADHRCGCGGQIVWDETQKMYLCESCGQRKCADCSSSIETDQPGVYCMRCEDSRAQIMVGNY